MGVQPRLVDLLGPAPLGLVVSAGRLTRILIVTAVTSKCILNVALISCIGELHVIQRNTLRRGQGEMLATGRQAPL